MMAEQKRKEQGAIYLFFVTLYFIALPTQAQYGGGSGIAEDPYLIYTAEQMNEIGLHEDDWDKHFKLMADIDLSTFTGIDFNIIGYSGNPFKGVFDGNGYTISNFIYTSLEKDQIGLFGYVDGKNAQIKDLGFIDPKVDALRDVGSLVGQIYRGTITNCYVEDGSITGNDHVGGLVGQNLGTIKNCYSNATVTGGDNVGGLVGYHDIHSTITNCYSTGIISGREYVGGMVGNNRGTIVNCYAMGSVSGIKIVGGIVGGNGWPPLPMSRPYPPGDITNCYSTVNVSGNNHVGGLVGKRGYGRVTSSFWDIQTSSQITSDGGAGKTTAEMQMVNTFITWGCEPTVWSIDEGVDYPRLAWENKDGHPLPVLSEFLAGSGTQTDPYLIYTVQDIDMIGQFPCEWSKHFKLMVDIDLSGFTGKGFNVIGDWRPFTGVFDGNAHTISNFSYTSTEAEHFTEAEYFGLFGHVGKWGEDVHIKDLGLINPDVDAGTGTYVGSLIGRLHYGAISGCYAKGGNVSGKYGVGGLVGWLDRGTITNCYSSGSVRGVSYVGGLTGNNYRSSIINSYSTGSVSGNENIGGLLGDNFKGEITNSFWDKETSSQPTSAGGMGKTTAEMQTASTFLEVGWDFVDETENGTEDIWKISEGLDYPRLWWEPSLEPYKYAGGTGEPNNPYRIASAEDLMLLGKSTEDYGKHFILIADIDLDPNLPGRRVFDRAIISNSGFFPFTGVFDGNGHVISNLNIQRSGLERFILPINHGLFGQLQSEAEVRNLGINDVHINISVSSDDGYKVGGIAGVNFGNVIQCHSTGSVSGGEFVGGLVGHNGGNVAVCYSTCAVTGIRMIPYWIVWPGWPGERLVEAGEGGVGGLVGYNTGSIDMSYSTGAVSGNDCVGGLVGANGSYPIPKPSKPILVPIDPNLPLGPTLPIDPYFPVDPNFFIDPNFPVEPNLFVLGPLGWIKNCYATGSVTGAKRFGGLVGENKFGGVVTSFWDIETSGVTSSNAGAGKTTAEMQTASTFLEAGWDFVDEIENGIEDIWWIDEGQGYPRLWWEPSWEQSTDDVLFIVVDDFESYNTLNYDDPNSNRIYLTWMDGFSDPERNGAVVGHISPGEYMIAHSGLQSMPFYYDNDGPANISEATKILTNLCNWTIEGVDILSLWFHGNAYNDPEQMYVVLNDSAVVTNDNPQATLIRNWIEWRIDLTRFADQGVNLAHVNSITIGFGDKSNPVSGGSGKMYFDDIRLYRPAPEPAP